MTSKDLKEMNNQIKSYINEASGISSKCKIKLIKLVEKHFFVELPHDNYLNIDIEILENGNIIMRDKEYITTNSISDLDSLSNRYNIFKEEVETLLNKHEVNFTTMTKKSEINNLIYVFFHLFAVAVITIYCIHRLLLGDLFGCIWIVVVIGYILFPNNTASLKNKYTRAIKYLKSLIYKR